MVSFVVRARYGLLRKFRLVHAPPAAAAAAAAVTARSRWRFSGESWHACAKLRHDHPFCVTAIDPAGGPCVAVNQRLSSYIPQLPLTLDGRIVAIELGKDFADLEVMQEKDE